MKRKDYLKNKLSKEEKLYLKRIIMTARNLYIKKNKNYLKCDNLELREGLFRTEDTIIDLVVERCMMEVNSAEKFEEALTNTVFGKYKKALSLREKEVLFYLFWEEKQINDVAKIMGIHRNTVRKIRDRALTKIAENMLKGDD